VYYSFFATASPGVCSVKCCGVDIAGNGAALVTLERDAEGKCGLVEEACTKIVLRDGTDQAAVRAFSDAIEAFARNHGIGLFAIRGRAEKGKFAGGANSFKIEGILQVAASDVVIVPPQTISAFVKRSKLEDHPELANNQQRAFQAACCALSACNE
jgi:hypothetical protein